MPFECSHCSALTVVLYDCDRITCACSNTTGSQNCLFPNIFQQNARQLTLLSAFMKSSLHFKQVAFKISTVLLEFALLVVAFSAQTQEIYRNQTGRSSHVTSAAIRNTGTLDECPASMQSSRLSENITSKSARCYFSVVFEWIAARCCWKMLNDAMSGRLLPNS